MQILVSNDYYILFYVLRIFIFSYRFYFYSQQIFNSFGQVVFNKRIFTQYDSILVQDKRFGVQVVGYTLGLGYQLGVRVVLIESKFPAVSFLCVLGIGCSGNKHHRKSGDESI